MNDHPSRVYDLIDQLSRWWTSLPPDSQPALHLYYCSILRGLRASLHGSDYLKLPSLEREVGHLCQHRSWRTLSTPSSAPINRGSTTCGKRT